MKKKILCFLLTAVMLLSCLLTGCGNGGESAGSKEDDISLKSTEVSGKYIVQSGKSDYVLVLPNSPMELETYAAEEFNTFMEMANGCTLEIVSEANAGSKFISIGNTQQFREAFPDVDLTAMHNKQSTYFIGTKGDNIYVASGDGYRGAGSQYAIYDLLHDLIGYTYYYDTEIYVDEKADVSLRNYGSQTVEPSFDMRTLSTQYIYGHHTHNDRLRFINFSQGVEWDPVTFGHSQLMKYLHPTDTDDSGVPYGQSHPEWFFNPYESEKHINHNQLCWTAGGNEESLKEMQTVVANRLIMFLQMNQDATFFMFGQHDNEEICTCDGCQAARQEWAGSPAGLQINFFNGVLEQVEAWRQTNQPNREVYYVVYAYHFTQDPPVKQNEDGSYVPYSDKVVPHERMRIFYAPVYANYAFTFDIPSNKNIEAELGGWNAVCDGDQLFVYIYDLNCWNYFIPFFNFTTTQSILEDFQEAGVSYILSQGVSDTPNVPGFQELKAYVTSNLMWNLNLNYQDLAEDFIKHFYKDAAEYMQNVYDMILDQNTFYNYAIDPGAGTIQSYPTLTELYPKAFVEKMEEQLQLGLEAIDHYRETDPEMYELLESRIMKEYLNVYYWQGMVYGDSYSEEELAEIREQWLYWTDYFHITAGSEGGVMPEF